MVQVIRPTDLNPSSFNVQALATNGVTVKASPGTDVGNAIAAAITAIPDASDVLRGLVELAVAANYPQNGNDVDATTPAYVKAAIDAAIAALPGDVYVNGLTAYDAGTNVLTLTLSDGNTVDINLTQLLQDAVATLTAGAIPLQGLNGATFAHAFSNPLPTV